MTKKQIRWLAHGFLSVVLCGCTHQSASNPSQKVEEVMESNANDGRFSFRSHSFAALAFNTRGCVVVYANTYELRNRDNPSSPRPTDGKMRTGGLHVGIDNFPEPAMVSWKSLDGEDHLASIDIGSIFRDQRILHAVPKEKIVPAIYIGDPTIVLVVDDRTITVYMRAHIPVKELQVPGNKYSDYIADFIPAFERTY